MTDPNYSETFINENKIPKAKLIREYDLLNGERVKKHVTDPLVVELDQLHSLNHAIFF